MIAKYKNITVIIIVIFLLSIGYVLQQYLHPVIIVAVHQRDNFSNVLVKHFPYSDKGRIKWWFENKEMLKENYSIPKPASYGAFTITFWSFGEGYKEEGKYDRLCFDDMNTTINCIEKDIIFSVSNDSDNRMHFTNFDGEDYILQNDGRLIKQHYQLHAF